MNTRKLKRMLLFVVISLVIVGAISFIGDTQKNDAITISIVEDDWFMDSRWSEQVLYDMVSGREYNPFDITATAAFLDSRKDTSDFRLPTVIMLVYDYREDLSQQDFQKLKEALLNYKYWITDPGDDSMVYWSENHQILGAAGEYLAGQLFLEETFTNTGMKGVEHESRGKERVLTWLDQRWKYGFTEWYSNTYYKEDLAALSVLIAYSEDEDVVFKATAICDLLLYDMASQSFKGNFISTSGRAYEHDRKYDDNSVMETFMRVFWDEQPDVGPHMLQTFLLQDRYHIPEVLKLIAQDPSTTEIKASNGITFKTLQEEDLIGNEDHQIMMQWGMEAFTNSEVIENSLSYIREHELFSNQDLHAFKQLNYRVLLHSSLLPFISNIARLQTDGIAIRKAHTYTYRTPNYMMYTAQSYCPGEYGDQHHIFGVTLRNDLMVFHSHPAVEEGEKGVHTNSPNYWVGYGHFPHSAQYKNINLSIYSLSRFQSPFEKELLHYTHAWFPMELFDEASIEKNIAFGRSQKTYIALIASNTLRFANAQQQNDLICEGDETWWITEIGGSQMGESYLQFKERIRAQESTISYASNTLTYQSSEDLLSLEYREGFSINNQVQDLTYPRYDSPWVFNDDFTLPRQFVHLGHSLYLDFFKGIRKASS